MSRRWQRPEQLPLLDRPPDQRERVLAAIRDAGEAGVTRDELAERGVVLLQTCCAIVRDLVRAGKVLESGERRLTRAGHSAAVLVAAGIALPPAQTGDLIPRQLPARPDRARAIERETERRRREADAERIILAGRRAGQDDDTIRTTLAAAGLEWPR